MTVAEQQTAQDLIKDQLETNYRLLGYLGYLATAIEAAYTGDCQCPCGGTYAYCTGNLVNCSSNICARCTGCNVAPCK
jgi:hypothetical protein